MENRFLETFCILSGQIMMGSRYCAPQKYIDDKKLKKIKFRLKKEKIYTILTKFLTLYF